MNKENKISELWDSPLRWCFVLVDGAVLLCLVLQPPLWWSFFIWGSNIRDRSSCSLDLAACKAQHCSYFFLSLISAFSCTSQWSPFIVVIRRFLIMPIFSMPDTKGRATVRPWRLWGRQIGWQISAGKHASSWNAVQTSLALRWCWISVQRTALSWPRPSIVSSSLIHTKIWSLECYILGFFGFDSRRSSSSTTQRGLQNIHVPVFRGEKILY